MKFLPPSGVVRLEGESDTIGPPKVVNSPVQMPKASVQVSQDILGKKTSTFFTLLRDDGTWKICDQTEQDRLGGS